ncbi:hypothetical protein BGW38_000856, partial [Lunasporangiospora selenospora]
LFAIILNRFEHLYSTHSSSSITAYYLLSFIGAVLTIRTLSDLPSVPSSQPTLYYLYFGLICCGFIFEAWPRGRTKVQSQSKASPFDKANLVSRLWFHYIQDVITLGYRRPLQPDDVKDLMPQRIKTHLSYAHLSKQWDEYVAQCKLKGKTPRLLFCVMKSYGTMWIPILTFRTLASVLTFVAPELMSELLAFSESYSTTNRDGQTSSSPSPVALGVILSVGMFCSTLASSLMEGQFNLLITNMGIEARTALISMIYRKSLKLSPSARQTQTPGEISNHMSVDAERWSEAFPFVPLYFSIPLEICIAIWLLYRQLGWASMASVATIAIIAPIQTWIAAFLSRCKDEKLTSMDNRIRLINEVLAGMKIVKLYGWESSFRDRVTTYRNRELKVLRKIGVAFSFMSIAFSSVTLLMALFSFTLYAAVGGPNGTPGEIDSRKIFVSITLFGLLNRPIGMLSQITSEAVALFVATRRIERFLLAEVMNESDIERMEREPQDPEVLNGDRESANAVEITGGVFSWDKEIPLSRVESPKPFDASEKTMVQKLTEMIKKPPTTGFMPSPSFQPSLERYDEPTLSNINLSLPEGSLTAIVGRVGQGKTSLLSAMIGDMYKWQGTVQVVGSIAYVPQQAWIVNATVKDNILFGKPFDQNRYDRVVLASGLEPDFEMLSAGDQTEIGERGINLSGGQKQRVSLARAAYQDADIYLLDDPLSAVDAHVDQHLWQNLIGPEGLLSDKTRLLVTHGTHHLSEMDQIIVIRNGIITEKGQYEDLLEAGKAFSQLIEDYSTKYNDEEFEDSDAQEDQDTRTLRDCNKSTLHSASLNETLVGIRPVAPTALTAASAGAAGTEQEKRSKGGLVESEEMAEGAISWHVYKIYARAVSYRTAVLVLVLFVFIQSCHIGTNTWLEHWVSAGGNNTDHGLGFYMGIYAALVLFFMVLIIWTSYATMVSAGVRASQRLHERLLTNVLRLPMSFFDTTPAGRILNRFSADFFSIDDRIPWAFHDMMFCGIAVLGSLVVIAVTTPIFLSVVPVIMVIYYFVQAYYIVSSRAFKRIQAVTRSPMYQHFSETLSGVSTIRAMQLNERFIEANAAKSDLTANARFVWSVGNRWMVIRLEALGSVIVLAAALFAVLNRKSLSPSLVGMSLSYALNVTQDITWFVRCYCELQNELVCVERVKEYSEETQEAPNETDIKLPENWPSQGWIEFKNYSTRYRQGMDLVIKNVSFKVQPGEKVGIVGRTGAGKSSLTLALFRIIEAANSHWAQMGNKGTQKADKGPEAVNESVPELVDQLRRQLAIIPQDPTLFVGTVRENLDPFNEVTDTEIWEALDRAHLKDYIASMPGGLSYEVTQNGENFSVGQRSLVCLARALLRKTTILILDEATAAVDVETDELIQETIRKEFKDRTILTIAHRIKTVMDSDKILVLEKGRVEEYESPTELLKRKESLFYKLADQAGEVL